MKSFHSGIIQVWQNLDNAFWKRQMNATCKRTFKLWYTSTPIFMASLKEEAPTGRTINSCIYTNQKLIMHSLSLTPTQQQQPSKSCLHSKFVSSMWSTINDIESGNRQNQLFVTCKICNMLHRNNSHKEVRHKKTTKNLNPKWSTQENCG